MISEGESDTVLTRDEYEELERCVDGLFEALANIKDAYGYGGRKRGGIGFTGRIEVGHSWWADGNTLLAEAKRAMVFLPTIRSVIINARRANAALFTEEPPTRTRSRGWRETTHGHLLQHPDCTCDPDGPGCGNCEPDH